jgi:hypothetical protein
LHVDIHGELHGEEHPMKRRAAGEKWNEGARRSRDECIHHIIIGIEKQRKGEQRKMKFRVFRCEEHLYTRLRRLVRRSVGRSVCPHDAITWKTSYVAINSRRVGGRGKLVMSRFLRT